MKKILISLAALSLVLTACGGVSKVEKKYVKAFEKLAKEYDAEFLMVYQSSEDKTEEINEFMKHVGKDELEHTYSSSYTLYDKDGESLLYMSITEYKDEIDKSDFQKPICVVDKVVVTLNINEFDGEKDAKTTFKETCLDVDGKHTETTE